MIHSTNDIIIKMAAELFLHPEEELGGRGANQVIRAAVGRIQIQLDDCMKVDDVGFLREIEKEISRYLFQTSRKISLSHISFVAFLCFLFEILLM